MLKDSVHARHNPSIELFWVQNGKMGFYPRKTSQLSAVLAASRNGPIIRQKCRHADEALKR
jgi:hypothetical protein